MADISQFPSLTRQTADEIRARLDADVNAGLDPSDEAFTDTTVGGFYYDLSQAMLLELERLWDFASVEVPAAMLVPFAWGEYLDWHGTIYGLTRKDAVKATGSVTFTGTNGTAIATGTRVSTESPTPDSNPVEFVTTESGTIPIGGTLTLQIEATEYGTAGNVAEDTITQLLSSVSGIASLTNDATTSGGSDVESDESYCDRLTAALSAPEGAGNVADYERWALAYPGVGHVKVEPVWAGAGTVRLIITDEDNNPASQATIDGLQSLLDPVVGEGRGLAPIGATVTVATPVEQTVTVALTVSCSTGYSLDGAGGTIAVSDAIEATIIDYMLGLSPGDDVVLEHVKSCAFRVEGVYDVTAGTLNGSASNVSIAADHVARAGTITLT